MRRFVILLTLMLLWLGSAAAQTRVSGFSGVLRPAVAAGPKRYVFIGDSLSAGAPWVSSRMRLSGSYPSEVYDHTVPTGNLCGTSYQNNGDCSVPNGSPAAALHALLPNVAAINQGIGSTTCADTDARFGRDALADGSDPGDGTPDSGSRPSPLVTLTASADVIIIVCGINDDLYAPATLEGHIASMVAKAKAAGKKVVLANISGYITDPGNAQIAVINAWEASTYASDASVLPWDFHTWMNDNPSYVHTDNLHLTVAGYAAMAQQICNLMVAAGWTGG